MTNKRVSLDPRHRMTLAQCFPLTDSYAARDGAEFLSIRACFAPLSASSGLGVLGLVGVVRIGRFGSD